LDAGNNDPTNDTEGRGLGCAVSGIVGSGVGLTGMNTDPCWLKEAKRDIERAERILDNESTIRGADIDRDIDSWYTKEWTLLDAGADCGGLSIESPGRGFENDASGSGGID
jgi:hypothetical protein